MCLDVCEGEGARATDVVDGAVVARQSARLGEGRLADVTAERPHIDVPPVMNDQARALPEDLVAVRVLANEVRAHSLQPRVHPLYLLVRAGRKRLQSRVRVAVRVLRLVGAHGHEAVVGRRLGKLPPEEPIVMEVKSETLIDRSSSLLSLRRRKQHLLTTHLLLHGVVHLRRHLDHRKRDSRPLKVLLHSRLAYRLQERLRLLLPRTSLIE